LNGKDSRSNSDNITMSQKYLDKIVKMQQDQEKARQQEYDLLQMHLSQMNILLDELIKVSGSGSTVASTKKLIPFQTGSQEVGQQLIPPSNPDDYPTRIDVYKINDNKTVPHMTLINDGPGDIFFISSYSNNQFNSREEHLNVNDQRELFNVYEVRLRSTLPTTTIRLIEGIFRTGSTAPQTKINVEIRPTVQTNEILLFLTATFDIQFPTITITSPTVQTFGADYSIPFIQPPLPPGHTCTLIDQATGIPMPFNIPEGFIFELFAVFSNSTVDFTARNYFELVQGSGVYSTTTVIPISQRGPSFNATFNISEFNSALIDPFGSPIGGRNFLLTVTNDDPLNNMIGEFDVIGILRRMS
jgi:hypothetical protein